MNNLTEAAVTIGVAIVGVAILSVIVSRNSQTPAVISAFGGAFSNALGVAVSPVSGASVSGLVGLGGMNLNAGLGSPNSLLSFGG